MTDLESIAAAARPILDDVAIEDGEVRFLERFDCGPDEEPHDVAWDTLGRVRDALEEVGLTVVKVDSDNDSLWGRVVWTVPERMTDEAAFLRAIIERPADPLPRIVFADWLEELCRYADGTFQRILAEPDRDDLRLRWADAAEATEPERAEFVRVQCELAAMPQGPFRPAGSLMVDINQNKRDALRRREQLLLLPLLGENARRWTPPEVYAATGHDPSSWPINWRFTRGFVSAVTLSWEDWVRHSAALLGSCPIRRVNRPKACGMCHGRSVVGGISGPMGRNALASCPTCRGAGRVDDWRGDGLVRLTAAPDDDACIEHGAVVLARDGRPSVWTFRTWPGVRFELPAAAGTTLNWNDGARTAISEVGPCDHLRPGVAFSVMRGATYRAILADTPEARP